MKHSAPVSQLNPVLNCQSEVQKQDLDWSLAHFTFVADITTLASRCDIVCSPEMSVAVYRELPFPALSFLGDSVELLVSYTRFLVEAEQEITLLVNEAQRAIVEEAFIVSEIIPEWQLVYRGDPQELDSGDTELLVSKQLPAMQKLAQLAGLTALEKNPLAQGPAFGIWAGRTLVAMGGTHLELSSAVEIGNIATHPQYRRQGYAAQIVAALVQVHQSAGRIVFLMSYQSNLTAVQLYEKLGFERERPMYLIRCLT